MKRIVALAVGFALGLISVSVAYATRNTAGTYSLPSGNPVVTGTTITSTWANNTLSDIGTELTNSLSRDGYGAMRAILQCVDGTVAAPGITFANDLDTGLYRIGANNPAMSAGNVKVQEWSSTTTTVPLGLTATQSTTNGNGITATGNGTGYGVFATGGGSSGAGVAGVGGSTNGNGVVGQGSGDGAGGVFGGGTGAGSGAYCTGGLTNGPGVTALGAGTGVGITATGGSSGGIGGDFTGGGSAVALRTNGGGLQIGASGTKITASYGASYTFDIGGSISDGTCGTATQTLTGVTTAGVCQVSTDASALLGSANAYWVDCYVSAADTVTIRVCNATGLASTNPPSTTYRVRVFQP